MRLESKGSLAWGCGAVSRGAQCLADLFTILQVSRGTRKRWSTIATVFHTGERKVSTAGQVVGFELHRGSGCHLFSPTPM